MQPRDRDPAAGNGYLRGRCRAHAGRAAFAVAKNVSPVSRNREPNLWSRSTWVFVRYGDDTLFARDGVGDLLLSGGNGFDSAQVDSTDTNKTGIEKILP